MEIIVKESHQVIATIITNHSMSLDEAMALVGWPYNNDWGVWETDAGDFGPEDLEMAYYPPSLEDTERDCNYTSAVWENGEKL